MTVQSSTERKRTVQNRTAWKRMVHNSTDCKRTVQTSANRKRTSTNKYRPEGEKHRMEQNKKYRTEQIGKGQHRTV